MNDSIEKFGGHRDAKVVADAAAILRDRAADSKPTPLDAACDKLEKAMLDPGFVHASMLRGQIAKLSWSQVEHVNGPHPMRFAIIPLLEILDDLISCEPHCKCANRSKVNKFLEEFPEFEATMLSYTARRRKPPTNE